MFVHFQIILDFLLFKVYTDFFSIMFPSIPKTRIQILVCCRCLFSLEWLLDASPQLFWVPH